MKQPNKRAGLKPKLKVASVIGIVVVLFPIVVRQVRRAQTDPGGVWASELIVGLVVVCMVLTIVAVMRAVMAPVLRKNRQVAVVSDREAIVLVGHRYDGVVEALEVLGALGPRRVLAQPIGAFFSVKFDRSGISFYSSELADEALCDIPWSDVKEIGPGIVSMWSGDIAALALVVRSESKEVEFAVVLGSRVLWGAVPRSSRGIDELITHVSGFR